jgi:REP element-mobilizing transposase RayT
MPDHIQMCIRIAEKDSVAFAISIIKGKSAVRSPPANSSQQGVIGLHF